jgi:hypothetical protein
MTDTPKPETILRTIRCIALLPDTISVPRWGLAEGLFSKPLRLADGREVGRPYRMEYRQDGASKIQVFVDAGREVLEVLDVYAYHLDRFPPSFTPRAVFATLSVGEDGAFVLTLPESMISPKPEAPTPTLPGADYEAAELRALRVARDVLGARLIAKRGAV